MHTESFRLGVKRKLFDVSDVIGLTSSRDTSIVLGVREVEVVRQNSRLHVTTNNLENKSSINRISYTSSIVNFSDQEDQHLERYFLKSVQEDLKLSLADSVIFLCEGIRNVPTNTTELSSILHDSMEETESKQELFVSFGFLATVQVSIVDVLIGLDEVRTDT